MAAAVRAASRPSALHLVAAGRSVRQVVLESRAPLEPHGFRLGDRWVVDLDGAVLAGRARPIRPAPRSPVAAIRIGQFRRTTVRLVFTFRSASASAVPFTSVHREGEYRLVFDLPAPAHRARVAAEAQAFEKTSPDDSAFPRQPLPAPVPSAGLTVRRTGTGWILRFAAPRAVTCSVERRGHRNRLYLGIEGAPVGIPAASALAQQGLPATVRVTRQASDSEQVVVHLRQPLRYQVWPADDGRAIILVLSPPQQQFVVRSGDERVTVDPGHGGHDPGTIGPGGIDEKAVTLSLATRLEQLMVDRGLDVQLTRISDSWVALRPRVQMGDEFRSNAFISIHMNHSDDPAIHGIETYYFTPQSRALADDLQRHLVEALGATDRGVRRDNFVVVKYTQVPACLVEVGYLSNPHEEKLLDSASYQERAAHAILAGLEDYLRHHGHEASAGQQREARR